MNKSTKDIIGIFGIFGVILFMIALIGFGPLLTVWSLNLLFNTTIAYSFQSWLAMVWLQLVTFGGLATQMKTISNKLN